MKTEAGQCADNEVHGAHRWVKTWGTWEDMVCAGRTTRKHVVRTVSAVERAFGAPYEKGTA